MTKLSYPVPRAHTQDWVTLVAMLRGMAEEAQVRADDLMSDEGSRLLAQASCGAYRFAALMIETQLP